MTPAARGAFAPPPDPIRAIRARIAAPNFPCAGAKAALAQKAISFHTAGDLRDDAGDQTLLARLQAFARDTPPDAVFVTLIALFPGTPLLDERAFEAALWSRLQSMHALDAPRHRWDPSVSSDPASPDFSMSLGGRGFYIVGLHPGASRRARRFGCAALVFNLHSQFEVLRADGRYDKLREAITARDVAFSGSRNPMLAVHGEASEARQYSGRVVGDDWRCPFAPTPARESH